jgi:hypothetical protein
MLKYKGFILSDKLGARCAKQTGLFTPGHIKHYLYVQIINPDGFKNVFKTTYQYNPGAVKFKTNDGLNAVLMDATAAADADNLNDFINEFGYDNAANARRAFNGCQRALDFFTRAGLTTNDLNNILEMLNNAE